MANAQNKVALITGGSRGIGKSIAIEFGSLGYDIVFNYFRNHNAAEKTQRQIEEPVSYTHLTLPTTPYV